MWLAREKSPMARDVTMCSVCNLPEGESQALPRRGESSVAPKGRVKRCPEGESQALPARLTLPLAEPSGRELRATRLLDRWEQEMSPELSGVVAEHIAAVNALDTDAIMATFADDAYVN